MALVPHILSVDLVIDNVGGAIGVLVWLALTRALIRGRDPARFALAADVGAMVVSMLIAIGQNSAAYAPADVFVGAAECSISLAACLLPFIPTSGRFYRPEPLAVAPWRGTLGSR